MISATFIRDHFGEAVERELAEALECHAEAKRREDDGKAYRWHKWRLILQSSGCASSETRRAQTAEFSRVVRTTLDGLGWWTKGFDGAERRMHLADWVGARMRARARSFHHNEITFYVDPNSSHTYPQHAYDSAEKAGVFERQLIAKARWTLSETLSAAGFYDATPPTLSPPASILFDQRTSWHWTPDGLKVNSPGHYDRDAEGLQIVEGQRLACYRNGRLLIGTALYGINNMWRIVHGTHAAYPACFEAFRPRPGLPARFVEAHDANLRVRRLLAKALEREDFASALVLKRARDATRLTLLHLLQQVNFRNGPSCSRCQAEPLSSSFRWNGAHWEHRCIDADPQAGHQIVEVAS